MTLAEREELMAAFEDASAGAWPEYNRHGDVLNRYWAGLFDQFADFQFCLLDRADEVMGVGHSIPLRWDRTVRGLPAGIDAAIVAGSEAPPAGRPANTLCAMAAIVSPDLQGGGLSTRVVQAMAQLASQRGLRSLIAPVRPSLKHLYPLAQIDRYAAWTRQDGFPFDPWLRVHARLNGRTLKPAPRSLRITGTVAEWEGWTGMAFPETGRYVFPQGLAPLAVNHERDRCRYFEPNVWVLHRV
ncbi:MAG TPA: N-acetyltransferase [Actinomycetota bacterium]